MINRQRGVMIVASARVVAEGGAVRWGALAPVSNLVARRAAPFQVPIMLRSAPGALAAARAALRARRSEGRALSTRVAALVVGGDSGQQRFCESLLQTLGLTVDLAPNAEDGVTAAARSPYRLVIVDVRPRGFDADLWLQVLQATASRHGGPTPDVYVVVDDETQWQGPTDCRPIQHPVRAVNLVRAFERLSR